MSGYDSGPMYQQYVLPRGARQTRLLNIQPSASRSAQLEASISVVDVDHPKTAYDALSYVWGDQLSKDFTIVIDSNAIPITESLASALRHIRMPDRACCIWIDTLCINQNDSDEKADQVAMMGDIYRRCSKVQVWLPGPTATATSLDTTASLRALFSHIASDHFHNIPGYSTDEKTGRLVFEETSEFSAAWEGFQLVAESPWWTRAWTVQEASLPPRLRFIYGTAEACDFELLSNALDSHWRFVTNVQSCCTDALALFPQSKRDVILALMHKIRHITERRAVGKERDFDNRDFLYVVVALFAGRTCLEPRDRIYSLWSQAVNDCYRDHTPSYTQPLDEVFSEVFRCMLREAQNDPFVYSGFDFRALYGPGFGPHANRPSWVPDFLGSRSMMSVESQISRLGSSRLFRASGWKKSTLRVSGDELHLDGAYADRILAVGLPVEDTHVDTGCKAVFDQWRDMIRTTGTPSSRHHLARLLCIDMYAEGQTRPRRKKAKFFLRNAFSTHLVKLWAEIGLHGMANSEMWRRAEPADYLRDEFDQLWEGGDISEIEDPAYLRTITTALTDRALYVTEGGRMGLCMPHAAAGDQVWVVFGSKLPFVLRPAGEGYNFIGDCYLQGAMDGEFVGKSTHVVIQ